MTSRCSRLEWRALLLRVSFTLLLGITILSTKSYGFRPSPLFQKADNTKGTGICAHMLGNPAVEDGSTNGLARWNAILADLATSGGDHRERGHQWERSPTVRTVKRRAALSAALASFVSIMVARPMAVRADDSGDGDVLVTLSGEAKQLFNEGRAKEQQGNVPAAQRMYAKVTKMEPRYIYGWSNLGNAEVALGALDSAEESYTKSIILCNKDLEREVQFGVRRCDDLYLLLLNRGSVRLNNGMSKEALQDLEQAASLRGKPDAIILQNRARARELNGQYTGADRDYSVAISMTSNEVAPFWLRAALVKFQLGETIGAFDLIRRVENRFPDAPEVRAALAALLWAKGDQEGARRKYLEIPDRQRLKFVESQYLAGTISWPPAMIEKIGDVAKSVGDTG